jgi:hypothetical protein
MTFLACRYSVHFSAGTLAAATFLPVPPPFL